MTTKEPEQKPEPKICPFNRLPCTPNCACFTILEKPIINQQRGVAYPDQELFELYIGCGLVIEKRWVTVKREPAPEQTQTPEEQQAEEAYKKLDEKGGEAKNNEVSN